MPVMEKEGERYADKCYRERNSTRTVRGRSSERERTESNLEVQGIVAVVLQQASTQVKNSNVSAAVVIG